MSSFCCCRCCCRRSKGRASSLKRKRKKKPLTPRSRKLKSKKTTTTPWTKSPCLRRCHRRFLPTAGAHPAILENPKRSPGSRCRGRAQNALRSRRGAWRGRRRAARRKSSRPATAATSQSQQSLAALNQKTAPAFTPFRLVPTQTTSW